MGILETNKTYAHRIKLICGPGQYVKRFYIKRTILLKFIAFKRPMIRKNYVFQISILGDALDRKYEPPTYL
jgi:hypothetical protein